MSGNANLDGTITIQSTDGRYMKVSSTDGLYFPDQVLDDFAKFTVVKYDGGKVGFTGSNGQNVVIYYLDDVKCDGAGAVLELGVTYLPDGFVNFTIYGYQSQNGQTRWLSSQAGNASYNGSIAALQYEDFTCRFKITNV